MLTLKEYRRKLKGLRNTRKMTKTMRMIAVNKLYRAQAVRDRALPYVQKLAETVRRAAAAGQLGPSPLTQARDEVRAVRLVVLTSDRGVCGGFNNNVSRLAEQWAAARRAEGRRVNFSFCGKRGQLFFKARGQAGEVYEDSMVRPGLAEARRVAADVQAEFLSGAADEVFVAYNRFRSAMSQAPVVEPLLPVRITPSATTGALSLDPFPREYLLEPDARALTEALVGRCVQTRLLAMFLDSAVGEQAARMMAMENATQNADDLIESYTLQMNHARQAAITRELMEIVAGAEALKTHA